MNLLLFSLVSFITLTCSNLINILQLTDIHLDRLYQVGAPNNCKFGTKIGTLCCHSYNIPLDPWKPAKEYGDFNCDAPYKLVYETLEWIKNNIDIQIIFWTGDNINHHDFFQSTSSNLKLISNLTNEIKLNFPKVMLIPVIGNHDMYPIDQFNSNLEIYKFSLYELSKIWNITNNYFLKYGFYSIDFFNTRLIVLNNLIWDNYNFVGRLNNDSSIQWHWLENEIKNCNNSILIIGHIPPTSSESTDLYSDNFETLMTKYKNKIKYSFFGHTHNDEYFLIKNEMNETTSIGFMAPSLVPLHRYPGFRVYQYNITSNEIINYQDYYLNLTKINAFSSHEGYKLSASREGYKLLYDFKKEYNINGNENIITSFNILTYNMIKNDTLFKLYCKNYYNGYEDMINKNCQIENKKRFLCDILIISNRKRKDCVI